MTINGDGQHVRFTIYVSNDRLSKRFTLNGTGLNAVSGTNFASGGYIVCPIPADLPCPEILTEVGKVIDTLTYKQAIGLGVPKDGSERGTIITKGEFDKLDGNTNAITRTLHHFGWPEKGLLFLDADDRENLVALLIELCPQLFDDVSFLIRPSVSASVIDPQTGQKLKTGEHTYCLIDDVSASRACLKAINRLAWCKGLGFLKPKSNGHTMVKGPVDDSVGSPERVSYEGEANVGTGVLKLLRASKVIGGSGMLCASALLAYADEHAPQEQYAALVAAAKASPEFIALCAPLKAAAKANYIEKAISRKVAKGMPAAKARVKATEQYEEMESAGSLKLGEREVYALAEDYGLFWPNGKPFTVSDIQADPLAFHGKECADPIEGMDYQTKNCAIIYTDGDCIMIYSRAHGDAFAYTAPLHPEIAWAEVFALIADSSPSFRNDDIVEEPPPPKTGPAVEPVDLWGKFDPPPLPLGLLPKVIEDFAVDRASTLGSDVSGFAVTALAVCAGMISDAIELQPKRNDTEWREAARLWVLNIGDPSTMKSPIITTATKPARIIDHRLADDYQAAMAKWRELPKDQRGPAPPKLRAMIFDTTIESTQEILRDSPNGVLLEDDELSGWFDAMYKYSGARGAQKDRSFWLQAYNGGSKTIDRVVRGTVHIRHLSISIAGASQPEPIRALANAGEDDGLLQRFCPVILRSAGGGRDDPPGQAVAAYDSLIAALRGLWSCAVLTFDDGALKVREELERKHLDLMQVDWLNRKLTSHIGKYNGMFARLCLIWHCVEHCGNAGPLTPLPTVVTEDTARRVADFLHGFLLKHAFAFYTSVLGLANDHDRLSNIADYILAHELTTVTNRDVQRGDQTMRRLERRETTAIFEQLEALGWVDVRPSRRGPGYPPHWAVNPLVHQRFEERAKASKERRERGREMAAAISASVQAPRGV